MSGSNGTQVQATQEARTREEILQTLDVLGGMVSGENTIVFEGEKIILPEAMRGNPDGVVAHFKEVRKAEKTKISFERQFLYRPFDGAVAFGRAMSLVFGAQGIGLVTKTMFGEIPPEIITVKTGLDEHTEAPWGRVGFKELDAVFTVGRGYDQEFGDCFKIACKAPRMHRKRIDGFFTFIEQLLKEKSIYKGHAVNGANVPDYINHMAVTPERVIYTAEVMRKLEVNVFTPIRHAARLKEDGISLKRAVLLSGRYGSGKTLAGMLTAQVAVENGWTFILVRADDDPFDALRTAEAYAPAVVMIEDVDIISAGQSREKIVRVLDALDSVSVKGNQIIAVFTTNFAEEIDRGLLRPGRVDAIIEIDVLDAEGYEKLVRSVLPPVRLAADINFRVVAEAFAEFLPAYASEAARQAYLSALKDSKGHSFQVTTELLLAAASDLSEQKKKMDAADEAKRFTPSIDSTLEDRVTEILNRTSYRGSELMVSPRVR
jgi:transitional endoplasmic reticulum ATPase